MKQLTVRLTRLQDRAIIKIQVRFDDTVVEEAYLLDVARVDSDDVLDECFEQAKTRIKAFMSEGVLSKMDDILAK